MYLKCHNRILASFSLNLTPGARAQYVFRLSAFASTFLGLQTSLEQNSFKTKSEPVRLETKK